MRDLLIGLLVVCSLLFVVDSLKGEVTDDVVLELVGVDGKTVRLTTAAFKELPRHQLEATNHDGDRVKYSGVKLATLLTKVGYPDGVPLRGDWVSKFLFVEARDGYTAVYALAELDETLTDRVLILADTCEGRPLTDHQGPYQIINAGEKRHPRWVRQVVRLRIVDSRLIPDLPGPPVPARSPNAR